MIKIAAANTTRMQVVFKEQKNRHTKLTAAKLAVQSRQSSSVSDWKPNTDNEHLTHDLYRHAGHSVWLQSTGWEIYIQDHHNQYSH